MKRGRKRSSNFAYALLVLLFVCILGASFITSGNRLQELAVVKFWYGEAGVEARDISDSHATLLAGIGIVGLIGTGTVRLLKQK